MRPVPGAGFGYLNVFARRYALFLLLLTVVSVSRVSVVVQYCPLASVHSAIMSVCITVLDHAVHHIALYRIQTHNSETCLPPRE